MKALVFGGSGLVGSRFIDLNKENFDIYSPNTTLVDILDSQQVFKEIEKVDPQIVINFAAFTDVQEAEKEKDQKDNLCFRLNVTGAKNVSAGCSKFGKKLIHISTDYVFEGEREERAYTEDDKPNPKNWYGQTKFYGEEEVKKSETGFVIVRISMPYVAHYTLKKDVARFFLDNLRLKKEVSAIIDQKITPTLSDDIANALAKISSALSMEINKSKLYHVSVTNNTTPFDFATLIAEAFNLDASLIKPVSLDEYNKAKQAKLLRYSRLDPSKFIEEFGENILHTVEENVKSFKQMVDE